MPLGIGFLVFVARNPDISENLGLISAKADLAGLFHHRLARLPDRYGGAHPAAAGLFLFVLIDQLDFWPRV